MLAHTGEINVKRGNHSVEIAAEYFLVGSENILAGEKIILYGFCRNMGEISFFAVSAMAAQSFSKPCEDGSGIRSPFLYLLNVEADISERV